MKKVELLAPAGNLEKLKMAIAYGADAVYIGGEEFGLRAGAGNFTLEEMKLGVDFAHARDKKVYLTMNIIPHNEDLVGMEEYVRNVEAIGIDAIIVSDPGVFSIVRETAPGMETHISTQANNTNWRSAKFWHTLGAKRIVLARELSLPEIKEAGEKLPSDMEMEMFVHGAMCISYSGRCLLSNYMAGRDANKGDCAQSCRWKYYVVEEKRPGEYMPVVENERGTYIYNSKDLCLIRYIPEIIQAGVTSLKIEGRMKSSFYVAQVVKGYRDAIDTYYADPAGFRFKEEWQEEVSKASHREYTTGFFHGRPDGESGQNYATSSYLRGYDFIGMVLSYDADTGIATVEQRNRMFVGEEIEVVSPMEPFFTQKIQWMKNADGEEILSAPHPQMIITMPMDRPVGEYTMLRRKGM